MELSAPDRRLVSLHAAIGFILRLALAKEDSDADFGS
jgi:hypothetical protein